MLALEIHSDHSESKSMIGYHWRLCTFSKAEALAVLDYLTQEPAKTFSQESRVDCSRPAC